MRLLMLAVLLAGCATPVPTVTKPERARFLFQCENGILWSAVVLEGWEEGYMAEVGHCIGDMKIIGPRGPTTNMRKWI